MNSRDAAAGLCLAWCGRHCERLSRARGVPLSTGQSNLSSRDMAALGILLAAFANLGIKPKTVISSEGDEVVVIQRGLSSPFVLKCWKSVLLDIGRPAWGLLDGEGSSLR